MHARAWLSTFHVILEMTDNAPPSFGSPCFHEMKHRFQSKEILCHVVYVDEKQVNSFPWRLTKVNISDLLKHLTRGPRAFFSERNSIHVLLAWAPSLGWIMALQGLSHILRRGRGLSKSVKLWILVKKSQISWRHLNTWPNPLVGIAVWYGKWGYKIQLFDKLTCAACVCTLLRMNRSIARNATHLAARPENRKAWNCGFWSKNLPISRRNLNTWSCPLVSVAA